MSHHITSSVNHLGRWGITCSPAFATWGENLLDKITWWSPFLLRLILNSELSFILVATSMPDSPVSSAIYPIAVGVEGRAGFISQVYLCESECNSFVWHLNSMHQSHFPCHKHYATHESENQCAIKVLLFVLLKIRKLILQYYFGYKWMNLKWTHLRNYQYPQNG